MKTTLVMLAVTKMQTGVCIAGVRRDNPAEWIRPVRGFGTILLGDITYPPSAGGSLSAGHRVMRPFDLVDMTLDRVHAAPPFVEDWTCDFAHQRPRLIATVPEEERGAILDATACHLDDIVTQGRRSLGAIAVDHITATFRLDTYSGKFEARMAFAGLPNGLTDAACTDLKWRAFGRRLLADHLSVRVEADGIRTLMLTDDDLRAGLGGAQRMWLALGLSREYRGRTWPLVVGVHTLPDYEAEVDYTNL